MTYRDGDTFEFDYFGVRQVPCKVTDKLMFNLSHYDAKIRMHGRFMDLNPYENDSNQGIAMIARDLYYTTGMNVPQMSFHPLLKMAKHAWAVSPAYMKNSLISASDLEDRNQLVTMKGEYYDFAYLVVGHAIEVGLNALGHNGKICVPNEIGMFSMGTAPDIRFSGLG